MSNIHVYVLLAVLGWTLCAVLAAGFFYADVAAFMEEHCLTWDMHHQDLGAALLFGFVAGPLSLVVVFFLSGFGEHGWRLWKKK